MKKLDKATLLVVYGWLGETGADKWSVRQQITEAIDNEDAVALEQPVETEKKSFIMITPTTNIKDHRVVDDSKVQTRRFDKDLDVFMLYNQRHMYKRRSNLENVSLYEDVIIEGDTHYKILQMLTK